MTTESDSHDFVAKQAEIEIEEMCLLRKELADLKCLLKTFHDVAGRIDLTRAELRKDIQLTFKTEFSRSLANLKTAIDNSFSRMEDKVRAISR